MGILALAVVATVRAKDDARPLFCCLEKLFLVLEVMLRCTT
jgi:hypothetical protein